jgi:hypothetical protein
MKKKRAKPEPKPEPPVTPPPTPEPAPTQPPVRIENNQFVQPNSDPAVIRAVEKLADVLLENAKAASVLARVLANESNGSAIHITDSANIVISNNVIRTKA